MADELEIKMDTYKARKTNDSYVVGFTQENGCNITDPTTPAARNSFLDEDLDATFGPDYDLIKSYVLLLCLLLVIIILCFMCIKLCNKWSKILKKDHNAEVDEWEGIDVSEETDYYTRSVIVLSDVGDHRNYTTAFGVMINTQDATTQASSSDIEETLVLDGLEPEDRTDGRKNSHIVNIIKEVRHHNISWPEVTQEQKTSDNSMPVSANEEETLWSGCDEETSLIH